LTSIKKTPKTNFYKHAINHFKVLPSKLVPEQFDKIDSSLDLCGPYNASKDPIASLSLSLSTPTSSAFVACRDNEWTCGDRCIHRREFCDLVPILPKVTNDCNLHILLFCYF
jgi:hypothetical protein